MGDPTGENIVNSEIHLRKAIEKCTGEITGEMHLGNALEKCN